MHDIHNHGKAFIQTVVLAVELLFYIPYKGYKHDANNLHPNNLLIDC